MGLLSTETDEWFATQQLYTYDGLGRLIRTIKKSMANAFTPDTLSVSYALTNGTNYAYKVTTTSSHQPTTTAYYDGFGRNVCSGSIHFDGKEYVTDKTYINASVVGFETVPHISTSSTSTGTTYEYDSFFRPTLITDQTGVTTEFSYFDTGKEITENGITTSYEYDEGGKLVTRTDDKGDVFYYYKASGEYDKIQLSYMDDPDVFSTYTYDKYGRLTQLADPNGDTRTYVYNGKGLLQRFTFGSNKNEFYIYNKYGDVTKKLYRTTGSYVTAQYTYDSKRQLTGVSGPNFSEAYTYNASGMLTNKQRSVSVENRTYSKSTTYIYNGESQVKSMTSTMSGVSFPIVETYDYKRGWITNIKLNNRLVWHLNSENSQGIASSTSNRLGTTSYTYDNGGRIKKCVNSAFTSSTNGNVSFQHNYTYDLYGRIATKDGKSYGYDNYNQLTSWNGKNYSYDERGNIAMGGGQTNITYNNYKLKKVTSPVESVWGKGNLSVSYNGFNKPSFISLTLPDMSRDSEITLNYDADGNRISAVKNSYLVQEKIVDGNLIPPVLENDYIRGYVDSRYEVDDCENPNTPPSHYYYVAILLQPVLLHRFKTTI